MRVVALSENVPHNGVIHLHHLTDLHAGAPDFAEEELRKRIALIEMDPWARWTAGGDMGDLIRHNDRRYSPTELHPRYRQATDLRLATMEHLVELFQPIADKCWGWAIGNHERKLDQIYGGHFGVEVCCALGIADRYVGYRGFIAVTFVIGRRESRMRLLIDIQHGWQQGRLKGAFEVQSERELGMTDADIILRGHNHHPGGRVWDTLSVTNPGRGLRPKIKHRYRAVINGGSWRWGMRDLDPLDPARPSTAEGDTWAETRGFRVEQVGGPVLRIRFDQGLPSGATFLKGRAMSCSMTIIEGAIDAKVLGLAEETPEPIGDDGEEEQE